jgi:hypothetical protein
MLLFVVVLVAEVGLSLMQQKGSTSSAISGDPTDHHCRPNIAIRQDSSRRHQPNR